MRVSDVFLASYTPNDNLTRDLISDLRDSRAEAAAAESLRAAMQEERNQAMREKELAEEKYESIREKARAVVGKLDIAKQKGWDAWEGFQQAIDALREAVEGDHGPETR